MYVKYYVTRPCAKAGIQEETGSALLRPTARRISGGEDQMRCIEFTVYSTTRGLIGRQPTVYARANSNLPIGKPSLLALTRSQNTKRREGDPACGCGISDSRNIPRRHKMSPTKVRIRGRSVTGTYSVKSFTATIKLLCHLAPRRGARRYDII